MDHRNRLEIGGELSKHWLHGNGPSHARISSAFSAAGYEESDANESSTKSERIRVAVRTVRHDQLIPLLEEILQMLREYETFRDGNLSNDALTEAFNRSGYRLSTNGFLSEIENSQDTRLQRVDYEKIMDPSESTMSSDSESPIGSSQEHPILFVSHAHQDDQIAKRVIRLLRDATTIKKNSLFCTSIPLHGVSSGASWLEEVRIRIRRSRLTVFLISQDFLSSTFCCFELGATWALTDDRGTSRFPILLDDVRHNDLDPILSSWQCPVLGREALADLVDRTVNRFGLEMPRSAEVTAAIEDCLDGLPLHPSH